MTPRIPIVLITGTLGSGKTTLLQHIIRHAGQRLAVLMNEFGEIAIDSRVIQGSHTRIVELAGGCVCCELTGELLAAVDDLIDRYDPEMLLLEATGVAEADALVYEIEESLPRVRLDSVVGIVDAYTSLNFQQVGYVERVQLAAADILLVNKIDLVDGAEREQVESRIRRFNTAAPIFTTAFCAIDPDILLGPNLRRGKRLEAPYPHTHTPGIQSFTYISESPMDPDAFQRFAGRLPPEVFRAKGFVRTEGRGRLFNFVAGRSDIEPFEADQTRLVFIGRRLDAVKDAILGALKRCEV